MDVTDVYPIIRKVAVVSAHTLCYLLSNEYHDIASVNKNNRSLRSELFSESAIQQHHHSIWGMSIYAQCPREDTEQNGYLRFKRGL